MSTEDNLITHKVFEIRGLKSVLTNKFVSKHNGENIRNQYWRKPMSESDLLQEIDRLKAENEQLKHKKSQHVYFKVSPKGGVSTYGLGRFPVTLYKEQWHRLLEQKDSLLDFIKENDASLKTK